MKEKCIGAVVRDKPLSPYQMFLQLRQIESNIQYYEAIKKIAHILQKDYKEISNDIIKNLIKDNVR